MAGKKKSIVGKIVDTVTNAVELKVESVIAAGPEPEVKQTPAEALAKANTTKPTRTSFTVWWNKANKQFKRKELSRIRIYLFVAKEVGCEHWQELVNDDMTVKENAKTIYNSTK